MVLVVRWVDQTARPGAGRTGGQTGPTTASRQVGSPGIAPAPRKARTSRPRTIPLAPAFTIYVVVGTEEVHSACARQGGHRRQASEHQSVEREVTRRRIAIVLLFTMLSFPPVPDLIHI